MLWRNAGGGDSPSIMEREASWSPPLESGIAIDWIDANGLTFEVATMGEGDHLALCLHGFPELHYSWRNQMPILSEMGYRVWAPNLRGYGGTTRPTKVRDYSMDMLVGDIVALITASGAKKVTLLAHDWGAVIAWSLAITHPGLLERLVIMNVPHLGVMQRELRKWRQIRRSWYIFFFQLPWLPELLLSRAGAGELIARTSCNQERFGADVRAIYNEAGKRPGAYRAMVNYYRALVRHRNSVDLGDYTVDTPTLLLWGEEDVALNIHCTQGTEQWVPDITLKRFPDVSHWVQQDAPDLVDAELRQWLPKV